MDKNIAALLREDARTVHVLFPYDNGGIGQNDARLQGQSKVAAHPNEGLQQWEDGRPLYTYVTDLALKIDDYVVVPARGQFKLAMVKRVDDAVEIEPNADMAYAWVIGLVDVAKYDANLARNKEIEATVSKAYKARLKSSFAEEILHGVGGAAGDRLHALIAGPKS